jgi:hypothetical protein
MDFIFEAIKLKSAQGLAKKMLRADPLLKIVSTLFL